MKCKHCSKDVRKGYETLQLCANHYMKHWRYGNALHDAKAYLKAQRPPRLLDLAWAAGFLEGEGHFGINSPTARCAVIQATQVNQEPLLQLRKVFGGSLNARKPRNNQTPYFEWKVSGARARGIMMTLYLLLSQKRRESILNALAL